MYDLIANSITIPKSLNQNIEVDLMEMKVFFQHYWKSDSAYTYFPFLVKDACKLVFQALTTI